MPTSARSLPAPRALVSRIVLTLHTRDLAARAGRKPPQITQQDYEQARRELTGERDTERQDARIGP